MLSYRTLLCVAWLLSAAADTECGVDADGQSTCTDQSNLLQAKVRVDVSDDVTEAVGGEPKEVMKKPDLPVELDPDLTDDAPQSLAEVSDEGSEQEEGREEEAQDESREHKNDEDGQEKQEAKDAEIEHEGGHEEEGQVDFAEVGAYRRRRISPEAREAKLIDARVKNMKSQVKWAKKALASLEHTTCRRVGLSTCAYCPASPSQCGHYCVQNTGGCLSFIGNVILNFASALLNFAPGGTSIQAMKKAAKLGKKALVTSIVKAAKEIGKAKVKDAYKKLTKKVWRESKDLAEDILEAALTEIAAVEIAQSGSLSSDIKGVAEEVIAAVDPTGVYDIYQSFVAETCVAIYDMPKVEWWQHPTQAPRHRRRRTPYVAPVRTTKAPGDCNEGFYATWSSGTSSYGCSRCYGDARRRRALHCTSGSATSRRRRRTPALKRTCKRHSDCYDSYWKWPKVLCTTQGCREQSR